MPKKRNSAPAAATPPKAPACDIAFHAFDNIDNWQALAALLNAHVKDGYEVTLGKAYYTRNGTLSGIYRVCRKEIT